mgnify:CR=1 FL=1
MEANRKGKDRSKPNNVHKSIASMRPNADLIDLDGPVADIQLGKSISPTVRKCN